jgi:microcystin degradation protein MlrC
MSARVLLAGLYHETHTFLDGITPLEDFRCRLDEELLAARGDESPLDGFLEVAERKGWQVVPAVDMRATPSATVEDAVVERYWEHLRERLDRALAEGIDAIYLVLHGAMVSSSYPDVEGELLQRIRSRPGAEKPLIFGVFDLHANVSQQMAQNANGLIAYRENPHTDARQSAVRAAELLARALDGGRRPHMRLRQMPIVWPPTGVATADEPMASLEKLARRLERGHPEILAMNVVAGFSFADTPDTGLCFLAVCDGLEAAASQPGGGATAEAALDELERLALASHRQGDAGEPSAAAVLDTILPVRAGPVVLAEPSDNIGGGAPGDGTGLLRALLERDVLSALVVINDPEANARLREVQPGDSLRLAIGGKGSRLDPGPVELDLTLVSTSDGRFTLEDRHSHMASMNGLHVDMGPCAVVRHRGITLLLTSRKTAPFDLGQLRSQGLEPLEFDIIGVKAAVAHRQAYDKIAKASHSVDTPGPCSSNLRGLPYRLIRRPIHPLDPLPAVGTADERTTT